MTTTVRVRGENGWVFEQDVPADGTPARARFEEQVAKGLLVVLGEFIPELDDDGVRKTTSVRREDGELQHGVNVGEFIPRSWPFESDAPAEPAGDVERPAKSANKAAWVAFAVSQGVEQDVAEAYSKDDLIALYAEPAGDVEP